ncbi:L,D-transpeptidase family protein [Marinobacter fonticola]|uniref:L,D-transpeptidase family protein n=1 Tax=Marinobacter fonticola TaxID=2603215 RepID=UPI0011E698A1|nr:L,D-transpeptidase family protein [Marinobacter fonticola]
MAFFRPGLIATWLLLTASPAFAEKVALPINGDLVGAMGTMATRYEDTFADIGSRNSIGYLELVHANPGVDPWLPGDGTQISLPQQHVLPDAPRDGIVINLAEFRLYYYTRDGVKTYPVGVGTEQNPSPLTQTEVTMRLESPAWYPPASVRAEYAASGEALPRVIPPGPENPLGPYALKLSAEGYLIHGTNKKFGIGMQVSHGCIRMYNEDIAELVYAVPKGTPVEFVNQPVKVGMRGNEVWLEIHRPKEEVDSNTKDMLWRRVMERMDSLLDAHPGVEFQRAAVEMAIDQADGVPRLVGERVRQMAQAADDTEASSTSL